MSLEPMASEKLRTIEDMSFDDVVIFKALPEAAPKVIIGRARKAYSTPFRIMQRVPSTNVAMISVRDREEDVLTGYISFYVFNDAAPDEETLYAYFHEELGAVVLLTATGEQARDAAMHIIVSTSIETSAGKVCCECGARAPQGGPKLKKCPCKKARYCSTECQHAHWPDHRACCSRGAAGI